MRRGVSSDADKTPKRHRMMLIKMISALSLNKKIKRLQSLPLIKLKNRRKHLSLACLKRLMREQPCLRRATGRLEDARR